MVVGWPLEGVRGGCGPSDEESAGSVGDQGLSMHGDAGWEGLLSSESSCVDAVASGLASRSVGALDGLTSDVGVAKVPAVMECTWDA